MNNKKSDHELMETHVAKVKEAGGGKPLRIPVFTPIVCGCNGEQGAEGGAKHEHLNFGFLVTIQDRTGVLTFSRS